MGRGPDISPCFLMNVLFEQLGWTGDAYMQAVEDCWKELPVIHNYGACITAEGELVRGPVRTRRSWSAGSGSWDTTGSTISQTETA